jgi:hypothetical protein
MSVIDLTAKEMDAAVAGETKRRRELKRKIQKQKQKVGALRRTKATQYHQFFNNNNQ